MLVQHQGDAWGRLRLLRMLTVKAKRKTIPQIKRRDGQRQGDAFMLIEVLTLRLIEIV